MADLTEGEIRAIDRLALKQTSKPAIAELIHCSVSSVYNHLNHLYPEDGSIGTIHTRKRSKGNYKGKARVLDRVKQYVLLHRFCTNVEIIQELKLNVTSKQTISNWLKQIGIGTYVPVMKQFLSPANKEKRCVKVISLKSI